MALMGGRGGRLGGRGACGWVRAHRVEVWRSELGWGRAVAAAWARRAMARLLVGLCCARAQSCVRGAELGMGYEIASYI